MSRHNHFPAGLKCIMDLCACRTHLPKISNLAELIFWIDVFQTTQNSLAETDTFLWNVELTCWNWHIPVEWRTRLLKHIPVPCITYLLDWTLRLEQDTSSQQFSKNAAHTPYINCGWIVPCSHQNFWCTVVLCYHFLRHMFWLIWLLYACQTKVTNLQTQQKKHDCMSCTIQ